MVIRRLLWIYLFVRKPYIRMVVVWFIIKYSKKDLVCLFEFISMPQKVSLNPTALMVCSGYTCEVSFLLLSVFIQQYTSRNTIYKWVLMPKVLKWNGLSHPEDAYIKKSVSKTVTNRQKTGIKIYTKLWLLE